MTTKADWLTLAERCEKATGPDRELSDAINLAIGYALPLNDGSGSFKITTPGRKPYLGRGSNFTTSLDAITALIEQKFPHASISSNREPESLSTCFIDSNGKASSGIYKGAKTEPLARCAAFCRLMSSLSPPIDTTPGTL